MRRLMREPLLHFLLLGGLLLLARESWWQEVQGMLAPPRIEISQADRERLRGQWLRETGRAPTTAEFEALLQSHIDDELLFREALRLGLHERDVVVHQRLILNMRFAEQDSGSDEQALLENALTLGMLHSDPVVRRRLIQKMRHRIESEVEVTEAQARAYFQRHREDFNSVERFSFEQRFFSADRPDALQRARLARQTLTQGGDDLPDDPFLLGNRFEHMTLADIRRRLGDGVAQALAAAAPGEWVGPVSSVYGRHLLRVQAVSTPQVAGYTSLRARIAARLYAEHERAAVETQLKELRRRYRIEVATAASGEAA